MNDDEPVLKRGDAVDVWLADFARGDDVDARFEKAWQAARTPRSFLSRRGFTTVVVGLAAVAALALGLSRETPHAATSRSWEVERGRSLLVSLDDVDEIVSADSHIAEVVIATPGYGHLVGYAAGETTVMLGRTDGSRESRAVRVVERPLPEGLWLDIEVGEYGVIELREVTAISVVDPEVARVRSAGRGLLLIEGVAPGRTDVLIVGDEPVPYTLAVDVGSGGDRRLDWADRPPTEDVTIPVGETRHFALPAKTRQIQTPGYDVVEADAVDGQLRLTARRSGTEQVVVVGREEVRAWRVVVE
ncbi:MAG: pilus assembly protein N-terminal domain-containing protein [Myxococcota bacterium]